uniref:Sorting nexin 8a n=1 Tax=Callorhinchus milii TaxID=7868 RepID=A0A4W3IE12_CALMI
MDVHSLSLSLPVGMHSCLSNSGKYKAQVGKSQGLRLGRVMIACSLLYSDFSRRMNMRPCLMRVFFSPPPLSLSLALLWQRFKSSVYRRYNDFVVFHEVLLQRFPYRMVPTLPPKRMLRVDREFIESRRRALKRFANLVARHPFFSEDELLQVFLSFSGSDVQNKIRESFRGVGDEFMTCEIATTAKDLLPPDIQAQFGASRELIRNIYNSFHKLRDRAERMASRSADNATDLLLFGKELSTLGSDTTPVPSWASVTSNTWGLLRQALRGLSVEFALLADKSAQQGKREEEEVVEKLSIFLDLLQSYKVSEFYSTAVGRATPAVRGKVSLGLGGRELTERTLLPHPFLPQLFLVCVGVVCVYGWCVGMYCGCGVGCACVFACLCAYVMCMCVSPPFPVQDLCERHEKGVLHEHQRALQKYTSMKRQMMSVTVQSKEPLSVEQLESRIVQQENAILNMELRNYFSMYCLHQETQLIHIYLHITSHVLTAFIDSQIQGHREMCEVWNDLKPKLGCLLPNGTPSPPVSPRPGAWHNPSTFFPQ